MFDISRVTTSFFVLRSCLTYNCISRASPEFILQYIKMIRTIRYTRRISRSRLHNLSPSGLSVDEHRNIFPRRNFSSATNDRRISNRQRIYIIPYSTQSRTSQQRENKVRREEKKRTTNNCWSRMTMKSLKVDFLTRAFILMFILSAPAEYKQTVATRLDIRHYLRTYIYENMLLSMRSKDKRLLHVPSWSMI